MGIKKGIAKSQFRTNASFCDGVTVEHPRYLFPPKVLRSWHGKFYLRSVRPAFESAIEQFRPDVVLASWAYPDAWAAVQLTRRESAGRRQSAWFGRAATGSIPQAATTHRRCLG